MFLKPLRAALLIVSAAAVSACSAFGGESAPEHEYGVLTSDGAFELRQYPRLVTVSTPMAGTGEDRAFNRLFEYISGANRGRREIAMTAPVLEGSGTEIAMTAPVLQSPDGSEIAMTAPVLEGTGGEGRMAFILPAEYTPETAPLPTDPAVTLGTIPERKVAAVTYDGRSNAEMEAAERAKLEAWIAARGLTATGPALVAQYDPPWTLPGFRRNEILIPVAD